MAKSMAVIVTEGKTAKNLRGCRYNWAGRPSAAPAPIKVKD